MELPTIEGKKIEIGVLSPEDVLTGLNAADARSTVEFSLSTADGKELTQLNSTLGAADMIVTGFTAILVTPLYHLKPIVLPSRASGRAIRATCHVHASTRGQTGGEGLLFTFWSGIGGS